MTQNDLNHVPFSEIVERIKDIISHDVKGRVYDYHVAEAIGIEYSALRVYKVKSYLPLLNVIMFCRAHDISIDWMIFDRNVN